MFVRNIYIYMFIPRGSKVWTICMHLGMHALRASDHAICGLTRIFACISDSLFSDWFPINSDSLWGIAADLVTVCHGLSRRFPTMPKIEVYSFLSFVTVRHGLSWFVTQHVRQFEANMNLFPITCNLRLLHFDNACAICDHQKWLHYLHAFPIWPYLCAWILRDICTLINYYILSR